MKRILLIALCLNMILGFSQSSQSTGSNLENEFSNATLENKHLSAFEFRATQKVQDYCNYIQLITDKTYDQQFRKHSKKMALGLFNSDACTVIDSLITGNQNPLSIAKYLDRLAKTDYHKIIGEASDIVLANDLTLTEMGSYLGIITYTQKLSCYDANERLIKTLIEKKEVGVTLSRKTKAFGETEKVIWVVNLCDIKVG